MVVDGGKWRPFRFRSPSGMTSFPVSAILDEVTSTGSDLTGNGKWGHPRWWPEAERPPFSTIHHHGVPKTHPVFWMTSVGRSDSLKTSYRRLPPHHDSSRPGHTCFSEILWNTFWWRLIHSFRDFGSIWSLASPRHCPSDWVSCPLATTGKWPVCTCQHHVPWKIVIHGTWCWLQQAPTLLFYFFIFYSLTVLYNIRDLLKSTVS